MLALLVSVVVQTSGSYLAVTAIKPGMKGYGLSVFSGWKTERFEVEVIDVMRNVTPKGDMILCRLAGADLEKTGVIAGMSGSPVYLDGRLAGAVAYAWGFSKEPIAGVTPIEQMLSLWEPDSSTLTPRLGGEEENRTQRGTSTFSPLPVPVTISGFSPALADLVGPALRDYGLVPVAAAGTAEPGLSESALDSLLVPGAAVGVALVDGDVQLAAIGTMTHREGDRFLAFGHPMLQAGAVAMPLVPGKIHSVLPALDFSFKLFSTFRPVGTVNQDRLPGIGGVFGPLPPMLPVKVSLHSPGINDGYSYQVIKHHRLIPVLTAVGLAEIVLSSQGAVEDMTVKTSMNVIIEDTAQFTVRHLFAGPDPINRLFRATTAELDALLSSRFRTPAVNSVSLDLEFSSGSKSLRIVSCRPDRAFVQPGGILSLILVLKDQDDRETQRTLELEIPRTVPPGRLNLVVSPNDSFQYRQAARAPGKAEPQSLESLIRLLGESGRENELVVAGFIARPGFTVGDQELPAPPPSLKATILRSGTDRVQTTAESPVFQLAFGFDAPISGVHELGIEVRR